MAQGTGEEWRAMDNRAGAYDRASADAVVARAKARIPQIRMRDVVLRVLDRAGRPLAQVPVVVAQTRQAFCFGDQLWEMDRLYRFREHETDRGRYAQYHFPRVLNSATALCYWTERPQNDGPKTEDLQGEPQLEGFAHCVNWARSAGLTVKGHPLFWSIAKCVPEWVKRYPYETQLKFAEVRVRNLVARFRGQVAIWDAVNEPLWEPAFRNLPQRHWPHIEPIAALAEYIAPVLRWARDEDPDACYLVNDYGLEQDPAEGRPLAHDGSTVTAARQRQRFLELVRCLGEQQALPNALGMQAHTGGWLDPATQWAVYDELSTARLPLHVTEFWAHTGHLVKEGKLPPEEIEQLQAEYVVNYLTCAFGHPAVEAFFFWGFMRDALKWREHSSHELKPLYHRVRKLLHEEWQTHLEAATDAEGRVRFRGFFGDYVLRYPHGAGMPVGVKFSVSRQQTMPLTLTADLPPLGG